MTFTEEMRQTVRSTTSLRCAVIDTDLTGALKMLNIIISTHPDKSDNDAIEKLIKNAEEYLNSQADNFDEMFVKNKRAQIETIRELSTKVLNLIKES